MKKVNELIEKNTSSRKTINNDLYYKLICAIATDEEYVATNVSAINADGSIVTEDRKLSDAFKKIFVSVLKKHTSMTEAEAEETANGIELTMEQAQTIAEIVHEAGYVAMKKCNKKIKPWNKPGFDISLSITEAPETTRRNPQDPEKVTVISSRDRVKVTQELHAFQKSVQRAKK